MRVLLDTHTFLWWVSDSPQLSLRALEILADGRNELFLSSASGWEIAIKAQLGKLHLPSAPERFVPEQLALNAMESLPIHLSHTLHVYNLPPKHCDPFDRLLVAQSRLERMPIITLDPQIAQYDVTIIW